ncbi:ribonuclease H-like YkuK family protein [Ammoniphilus sp. CFH 90114]|uniref:ribonuclease H-like YkuK family protein n=1 Tax=Ammoniphilus sp. CFH 90114 TaxID=2493665 RepID=UPI00100F0D5E|nr:ribonuclease H-like YkuK family protein [Ammoniphilus sp. CFH 90114]RXT08995.1 hypothetical protein EIZ39_09465 [Ammoniphilus sp. CFH 90114]
MDFISPTVGMLGEQELMDYIKSYVREDQSAKYKIVIGTDSQTSSEKTTFVTAVIIHRVGKGARFFFCKWRVKPMFDLRSRIYRETELSLKVMDKLKQAGIMDITENWPVEIHLDVGQRGETRVLIQEVVGWVSAVGYKAIIKPDSYGASSVADRFTKSG